MTLEAIRNFFFDTNDFTTKVNFGHPLVPPTIIVAYVVFCKWAGPALMRNRKPFNLKYTIIVYNFAQVLANAYIEVTFIKLMIKSWPIRCSIQEFPEIYKALIEESITVQWHCYLLKFVDLLDAVFFVLRKKERQVTFLHLFHHVVICSLIYFYVTKLKIGVIVLLAFTVNTFVHIVMYFYYFLAAFGPPMQKYLWWKKYLTLMQMTQFVIFLIYVIISISTGCDKAGFFEITFFLFIFALLILFLKFYKESFKSE